MEGKKIYTKEMEGIITYMIDVLQKEFPNEVLSPEYLIAAILDNKKCHANVILDNCLMSHNINELKKIYVNYLKNHINPNANIDGQNFDYNDNLKIIFKNGEEEVKLLGSTLMGSEHVLLSMLNPKNGLTKIQDVFRNMGIDYDFIFNKCAEKNNETDNKYKTVNPKMNPFPLKSDVNTKAMTNTKGNYIAQFTTSLNTLVKEGKIDNLIGREKEIKIVTKALARRKKNNVILVGKGGCGVTSIVHGIATSIVNGTAPDILKDKEIVQLNIMALVSGTHFRGMFEERVKGLFDELKANKNYILFFDDIQQVVKNSNKDKDTDMSQMIGDILTEGEVRVIGTTNFKDYKNGIESNASLARRFQKIVIEPSSVEDTIEILRQNKHYYEDYHNVTFSDEVIVRTVELADRYITTRSLPDSAIDIIDLSGAHTCLINREPENVLQAKHRLREINSLKEELFNSGNFEAVDELANEENFLKAQIADFKRDSSNNSSKYRINISMDDIATSVSDMTGVPVNKLTSNEKQKIAQIENVLKESVVGQDEAIESICKIIKRNKIGLSDKTKTLGNVLMLGPSGVGKCVTKETKIKIRNKKTSEIQELTIEDFIKLANKT